MRCVCQCVWYEPEGQDEEIGEEGGCQDSCWVCMVCVCGGGGSDEV